MTEVRLDYDEKLREIISKWEDSLDSNHDDYESVDGEEGDFGIVRYYGLDVDGNANVHLMTKYVHGGDSEDSYYTLAGAEMVQKIIRQNFEAALRRSLEDSLDPGTSRGMFHGWRAEMEKAAQLMDQQKRKFGGELHLGYEELFPKEIEDGAIYRVGYKHYVAKVHQPKREGHKAMMFFYNITNPSERLYIALKARPGHDEKRGMFYTHPEVWSLAFGRREIKSVVLEPDAHGDWRKSYSTPTVWDLP
uniref:Uncharacterized protein n=1 Tax=Pseudomonas phage HRDY3 TaxID=3236930 RepID=A0AB39CEW1_9VIRU